MPDQKVRGGRVSEVRALIPEFPIDARHAAVASAGLANELLGDPMNCRLVKPAPRIGRPPRFHSGDAPLERLDLRPVEDELRQRQPRWCVLGGCLSGNADQACGEYRRRAHAGKQTTSIQLHRENPSRVSSLSPWPRCGAATSVTQLMVDLNWSSRSRLKSVAY